MRQMANGRDESSFLPHVGENCNSRPISSLGCDSEELKSSLVIRHRRLELSPDLFYLCSVSLLSYSLLLYMKSAWKALYFITKVLVVSTPACAGRSSGLVVGNRSRISRRRPRIQPNAKEDPYGETGAL